MPHSYTVPTCLTISYSDARGAAGIQADLKTFSALGCYGTSVVTSVGIASQPRKLFVIEPKTVEDQLQAAVEYAGAEAIKVGLLGSSAVVRRLSPHLERLSRYAQIVVDPSLISRSGTWITDQEAAETIRNELLPLCAVATPNLGEAEWLLGASLPDAAAIETASRNMLELGPTAVVIKGGHRRGAYSDDLLSLQEQAREPTITWFRSARVPIARLEGAGCTLSSGIAAGLAAGKAISVATEEAKIYLTAALRAGSRWNGDGDSGPLHHFYAWWNSRSADNMSGEVLQ